MSRILKPDKRLIVPGYRSYRNLDEAMRLSNPEDGHNIDLWATIEVKNADGFSQGRHTFRCRSFVRQFIDSLQIKCKEGSGTVTDWCNKSRTCYGNQAEKATTYGSTYWFKSDGGVGWCWHGPVCGTGTTAAVISDYKMEKLVTHGTSVANASIITGTGTSESWNDPNYTLTKTAAGWTVNAYANDFLAFTSGAANGTEIPIYSNTATVLACSDATSGTVLNMKAFPPTDPGATPNFTVKTYGMLSHGSVAFTAPTDDGALQSKFSISRDFTNNQGGAFTVNEVGWMAAVFAWISGTTTYNIAVLMARDVLGAPVSLNNTQVMTLTYSVIANA